MEWGQFIPWTISGVSLVFCILTYARGGRKDADAIKESLIKANLKLDSICTVTNEMRNDIRLLDGNLRELDRRLTITERDLKTAFSRIDEIREERKAEHE